MDNTAAVNASPLIFFSRSRRIELLLAFAGQIYVPEPVAAEIEARGSKDITARVLDETPWLEVVPSKPAPDFIADWGLGPGETAVLALAYENPGMEAIIDEVEWGRAMDNVCQLRIYVKNGPVS